MQVALVPQATKISQMSALPVLLVALLVHLPRFVLLAAVGM